MQEIKFIIPDNVSVGYQNRQGTYTEKLGFVTYKDDFNEMKFKKSWETWKDDNIKSDEYENIPTSGFVLNKHSGRQWGNFERAEFVRVFDPRGFEFEITIDNLMQIILYNGITQGNGIEGTLVYGWYYGGRKVQLIPTTCPEYKTYLESKKLLLDAKIFEGKDDIKIGFKYLFKDGNIYTYLGKHKVYDHYKYWHNSHMFWTENISEYVNTQFRGALNFNKAVKILSINDSYNELILELLNSHYITGKTIKYEKNYENYKNNLTLI